MASDRDWAEGISLRDWAHGTVSTMCECYPDDCLCYEYEREFWADCLNDAFADAPWGDKHLWRVQGLPLWAGDVSGTVEVTTPADLLRAVTVNGDYRLDWQVEEDAGSELRYLWLTLYHHDVPTGRSFRADLLPESE